MCSDSASCSHSLLDTNVVCNFNCARKVVERDEQRCDRSGRTDGEEDQDVEALVYVVGDVRIHQALWKMRVDQMRVKGEV